MQVNMMKTDWMYNGESFSSSMVGDYFGFVYRITNLINEYDYVGRKYFKTKRKLKPLIGRKNKRHKIKETDWQNYWGSSKRLLEDIEKHGKHNFKREIICLCSSRGQTNYMEAKIQFDEDAKNLSRPILIKFRLSTFQLYSCRFYLQVPIVQLWRYSSCSGVSWSISTFIDFNLSIATLSSISFGTE